MDEPKKIKKIQGFRNVSGFADPKPPSPIPETQPNAAVGATKPVNRKLQGCNRRLGAPASDITPFDRQLELPPASAPPPNAPKAPRRTREAVLRNRWRQEWARSFTRYRNAEMACLRIEEQLYAVRRQRLFKELRSQRRVGPCQCALGVHTQDHGTRECMEMRLRACEYRLGLRE